MSDGNFDDIARAEKSYHLMRMQLSRNPENTELEIIVGDLKARLDKLKSKT